jgi:hypothetical protein
MTKKSELRRIIREEITAFKNDNLNENILDRLIDKIFDGLKRDTTDKAVKKFMKDNPEFESAVNDMSDAHKNAVKAARKALKDRD